MYTFIDHVSKIQNFDHMMGKHEVKHISSDPLGNSSLAPHHVVIGAGVWFLLLSQLSSQSTLAVVEWICK